MLVVGIILLVLGAALAALARDRALVLLGRVLVVVGVIVLIVWLLEAVADDPGENAAVVGAGFMVRAEDFVARLGRWVRGLGVERAPAVKPARFVHYGAGNSGPASSLDWRAAA
jgi:hypothetical protein